MQNTSPVPTLPPFFKFHLSLMLGYIRLMVFAGDNFILVGIFADVVIVDSLLGNG